jgi:hypothetical protein
VLRVLKTAGTGIAAGPVIMDDRAMQAMHAAWPGTQAPLSGSEAAVIGLAALTVVVIPSLWPLANQLDTMAHEGAHAVVASVLGFTVLGVTLDRNADGRPDMPVAAAS